MNEPTVTIEQDYDGAFERIVRGWVAQKTGTFKHREIHVDSGPYRSSAVSYRSRDGVLWLDFYAALRVGFGSLSQDDIRELIELL